MGLRLEGKRVLVTGAASGMGRAIASRFKVEGARLALLDLDEARLASLASEIGGFAYTCDVSDEHLTKSVVRAAIEKLGGLDGVVNAAGVLITRPFEELDSADWQRMIGVNLLGPANVIRPSLQALRKSQSATIVNVASVSGFVPLPGTSAYGSTKAGLLMLTKGLAVEFAPTIRVNAICPGVVKTEMTRYLWENPTHLASVTAALALKRIGIPEDIAHAALFLTCADSAFMTGTEMVLDGGYSWR